LLFRSLIEESHFSPLTDLEKNNETGLLRFTRQSRLTRINSSKRLELLEQNLIKYFRSRDEDNIKKPLPTMTTAVLTSQPISTPTRIKLNINETMNSSFWNHPFDDDDETTF